MNKPIVFFDLEATGLDVAKDRIVEIALLKWGDPELEMEFVVNPTIPIPAEATAIHGITDDDAGRYPTFKERAKEIFDFISGCDIAGYNCRNFDVPMLWEEFYRAGIEWKLDDVAVIDVGNIFRLQHPRDLTAAVKLYCKRSHDDAHGALADAKATADVFIEQLSAHKDITPMSRKQLHEYCQMEEKRVDLSGLIVLNKDGVPVFNTKRNKGVPVKNDPGYAQWFLRNDFSANTKMHIERILAEP